MRPLITLTTDFGTADGFVGAMKGKILTICPDANIVDITHDITPQKILQTSWTLLRSTLQFPEGSIHVVVVDPGVGSERQAILLKSENRWFIGTDNGVFSEIIRRYGSEQIYEIKKQCKWWQSHTSFDGLALFAPASAYLANGISPEEIGNPISRTLLLLPKSSPTVTRGQIQGQILFFDRFGNAITNISRDHLQTLTNPNYRVSCKSLGFLPVKFYQQGKSGSSIAIINSDGLLELSVFCDSAEKRHGLKAGDEVVVKS
ncbi:SAM-dependent chlorinase/fluorinase [bacterium]|nr:SAM-dependent chlorinase/fluorinase [bacterium]